jgi:hypothetical protein
MVFGQSRQEDLITYLLTQIPEEERERIVAELQVDLCPPHEADDQTRPDRKKQTRGAVPA